MLTPEDWRCLDIVAEEFSSGSKEIGFECLSSDVVVPSPKCCKERVGLRALARWVWEGVSDR